MRGRPAEPDGVCIEADSVQSWDSAALAIAGAAMDVNFQSNGGRCITRKNWNGVKGLLFDLPQAWVGKVAGIPKLPVDFRGAFCEFGIHADFPIAVHSCDAVFQAWRIYPVTQSQFAHCARLRYIAAVQQPPQVQRPW